jgi:hypothetical protein
MASHPRAEQLSQNQVRRALATIFLAKASVPPTANNRSGDKSRFQAHLILNYWTLPYDETQL